MDEQIKTPGTTDIKTESTFLLHVLIRTENTAAIVGNHFKKRGIYYFIPFQQKAQ